MNVIIQSNYAVYNFKSKKDIINTKKNIIVSVKFLSLSVFVLHTLEKYCRFTAESPL